MTQESEVLLRKSLDSVDRNRRRLNLVFFIMFCVLFGLLAWLSRITDTRELLLLTSVIVVFSVVYGVVVLAIYINRMARIILRAIDLLRKDFAEQLRSSMK